MSDTQFRVKFKINDSFKMNMSNIDDSFVVAMVEDKPVKANLGEFTNIESEPYIGSLTVTPTTMEQSLKTKEKRVTDDVIVKAIPFQSVSNPSGGYTATIG